jgi:hypothetical protein
MDGYRAGRLERAASSSVEAHLQDCATCQRSVVMAPGWLERSWDDIAGIIEIPRPSPMERLLTKVGVPQHTARLIAATPSVRPAWIVSVALVLFFAAVASGVGAGNGVIDLFLAVAPVVPVAGVAVAYGRVGDPAYEITLSAPTDAFRLLLLRSTAATLAGIVIAMAVDLIVGEDTSLGLWLMPALALTSITLMLGTRIRLWIAAVAAATSWLVVLLAIAGRNDGSIRPAFESGAQIGFAIVTTAAVALLLRWSDSYRTAGR